MDRPTISAEWTPGERLQLIDWLIDKYYQNYDRSVIMQSIMQSLLVTVNCITRQSKEFLEVNRDNVLDPMRGLPKEIRRNRE